MILKVPNTGRADMILHDVFENDVYGIAENLAPLHPRTIVDIGAHCGFFAVAAVLELQEVIRVVCVEPNPVFLECLRVNIEGTQRHWTSPVIEVVEAAIRHDGRDQLYVLPDTGMSMIYSPTENFCDDIKGYQHETVPVLRFEELYHHKALDVIDVLKIDVEGSEFDILANIPLPIRAKIRCIIGEYHHPAGWGVMKALLDIYYPHLRARCLGDQQAPIKEFIAL